MAREQSPSREHTGERIAALCLASATRNLLLNFVKAAIGAGRITSKACARSHDTPSFAYVISGRQALAVLSQVAPYLRTYKAERAHLLTTEYVAVTPRNGRYTTDQLAARARVLKTASSRYRFALRR
jgi:hypothetical protein